MKKIDNIHNWIGELPESIQREVSERFTERTLRDGEYLYHIRDIADSCYQIKKGRVKVCNYNYLGQEFVFTYLLNGDCIGDWGLLINEPRMNAVCSLGESVISILSRADFTYLYDKHNEIPRAINRVMSQRLRMLFSVAEDASLLQLSQRLARAIWRLVQTVGEIRADGSGVIGDVSHDELSRILGSTRQSIGRELKKMEKNGEIEISYNLLTIKNVEEFGKKYDNLAAIELLTSDYDDTKNT